MQVVLGLVAGPLVSRGYSPTREWAAFPFFVHLACQLLRRFLLAILLQALVHSIEDARSALTL